MMQIGTPPAIHNCESCPEDLGRQGVKDMTGVMDLWGLGCCVSEMLADQPLFAEYANVSRTLCLTKANIHQNGCCAGTSKDTAA